MSYYKYFFLIFLFLIFSCKTIEKKIYSKLSEEINEIYLDAGYSQDIKVNGKLLYKYDQINIDSSSDAGFDDTSIFDLSSDASSDSISKTYIYNVSRLKELKYNEKEFSDFLLKKLNDSQNIDNLKIIKFDSGTDSNLTRLDIKISEYQEGEYNLIKNQKTRILVNTKFYSSSENLFLLKKIYEINSDIKHPTENLRLDALTNQIITDINELIERSKYVSEKSE